MDNFDIASLKLKKNPSIRKSVSISVKPTKTVFGSISKKVDDLSIDEDKSEKCQRCGIHQHIPHRFIPHNYTWLPVRKI